MLASTSVDLHYSWLFVELGHDCSMLFHLHPWNGFVLGVLVQTIVCVCDLIESFDGDDFLRIIIYLWQTFGDVSFNPLFGCPRKFRINGING